jgi:predicted transcriptional regulator
MFTPSNLGPLEQKILSVVWNSSQHCTVTHVLEVLQADDKQLAYTTVMTILNRLVEKGYLSREKHGRSFSYHSKNQGNSFLKQLIRSTITNFAQTFGEEAISAFAQEASQLSTDHKRDLQQNLQPKAPAKKI